MKSSYFYRLLQIDHIRKPGDLPDEQLTRRLFRFDLSFEG